jgi:prepilin-type N-terminal cleavage/methylation domain-containing protein
MFMSKQKPRESELKTTRGFSLIEMILVASILAIGSTFSMLVIGPALQARASEMASRTVSMELRRARQLSVDTRRLLRVTFTAPKTITLDQQAPVSEGGIWTQLSQLNLPDEMGFEIDGSVTAGPDGFATSEAVNFSGLSQVFFMPDGSAISGSGLISSGVVYVARPAEVETTRAITVFGATGRVKEWQYVPSDGSWE